MDSGLAVISIVSAFSIGLYIGVYVAIKVFKRRIVARHGRYGD